MAPGSEPSATHGHASRSCRSTAGGSFEAHLRVTRREGHKPMSFTAHDGPGHASPGETPSSTNDGPEQEHAERDQGHLPVAHTSVNDQRGFRHRGGKFVVQMRQWTFWRQRPRVFAYMLTCELAATACIVLATLTAPTPTRPDWLLFATVAVCASAHLQLSRRQGKTRRSRKPTVHIDLVGIWSFAAVVVLPVHLALLSIVLSRTQRWFVA